MASQPSTLTEERNRLRLLAWKQRTQETSQTKDLIYDKFPVLGEPYKVYKEDELSSRIRRMFGSYDDVKSPRPFSMEGFPIPAYVAPSTKPPFHSQVLHSSTESHTGPSAVGRSSQPSKMLSASSSPEAVGQSSSRSPPSLIHGQSGEPGRSARQLKSEVHSELLEPSSPPPDAELPPPSHSTGPKTTDADAVDTPDRQRLHRSADPPAESVITGDVSARDMKQSPRDVAVSQTTRPGPLPSQTFPPPLSSKPPCSATTQKPTAYVRPMDGQDLLASESPELKPSPEPYVPGAEFISRSDLDKASAKPPSLETGAHEAQCVEDILREMTQCWPPVLTALHTPSTQQPSTGPLPAKDGERVSSCPGRRNHDSSSSVSSNLKQKPSSNSSEAGHSSRRDTGSSSDSDSSSGSESDSERTAEEPLPPPDQPQPDGPALGRGDWQLGNWIRSSQQSSGAEGHGAAHVSEGPAHRPLQRTPGSGRSGLEAAAPPSGEAEPQGSSHQAESTPGPGAPQQLSLQKAVPADGDGRRGSRKPSQSTAAGGPGAAATAQTRDSSFTDKPKVKTKAGLGGNSQDKVSIKIRLKRSSILPPALCPSCGAPHPDRSSCPAQSSAPPGPPSLAPPDTGSRSRSRAAPREVSRKRLKQPGRTAKAGRGLSSSPPSLLVRLDLSLLSRVPQTPSSSPQGPPGPVRPSAAVREADGGDASARHAKTSSRHRTPNGDVEHPAVPRKKRKLENSSTPTVPAKPEMSNKPAEARKKTRKTSQQPAVFKDTKPQSGCSGRSPESSGEPARSKGSSREKKKKNSGGKHRAKKPPKTNPAAPSPSQPTSHALTNRPLLRPEERRYPVKHYIKEAKRLKHRADAEPDKLRKAFSYLEAAMFFVESGIAMEKDPQISTSSYTMFAETVELLKFVLKLKSSGESSSSPSEKDFLSLCLKCQALLQMTMFRHKRKAAVKYSKTLTEHFATFAQTTHNPPRAADQPSPGAGSTAVLPQAIEQVAFNYVGITTLVLSSHEVWEQAEALAQGGGGLLSELDAVLGPLSLSSAMSSMVRYTRQGLHWLRLDSHRG
ncbi:AF4/FMR2 family member 1-like isoform X2 [Salarias fasciatus]|uniref:AF4/FMR2 family member 1-like isoform X2 n=1 Tax=Salarias fasciatus TaxID=181472 RepID=UPI001176B64F|nr:AF4/FMR2 family member 1-like isoform X2 [Salarias fasciatus]